MRIVGGKFKGSRLTVPSGQSIRPTSDRGREAIFNILSHGLGFNFDVRTVLDLFSGTGALGFEALSRGANRVVFIDNKYAAIKSIKLNGKSIGQTPFFSIRQIDASCLPARTRRDKAATLAFLDPPYRNNLITPSLLALDEGGWLQWGRWWWWKWLKMITINYPHRYRSPLIVSMENPSLRCCHME